MLNRYKCEPSEISFMPGRKPVRYADGPDACTGMEVFFYKAGIWAS